MTSATTLQGRLVMATRPLRYAVENITFRSFADATPLKALREKFAGQPLLIVGNGPSLNKTPLDLFANQPSIGMNKIDLIYPRTKWRPSLVICTNNIVMSQHHEEWIKHDIPVFLAWKGRHFIPRGQRSNFNYYNSTISHHFSRDIVSGVASGATVTYPALQFAHFMGADPIVIVGVDHSFAAPNSLGTYVRMTGEDNNHFDPGYFKAGSYWGLPDLEQSEVNYSAARSAIEADSRKVFDATIGGRLNIFPKISIDDAISIFQAR